jgi:UDP-N-acetylmuramoyl-L-alanyl-D-glutamate--2,6-diaminopimelate ligase
VAVKGGTYDGHDFIDQALAKGAKYIVCQRPCPQMAGAEAIVVEDLAKAAALLAQANRGWPASHLTNLAVTGTNGKTTVAFLVRSVINKAGEKCGLVGTIVYDTGATSADAGLTTPDCLAIAEITQQMLEAGAKYMVVEASSHALAQHRLAGINFKAAAFTNLAGDHLDYHKTQQDYLAAKSLLFEKLSSDATAVLNKESPHSAALAAKTKAKILWYAIDTPADLTARIESMDTTEMVVTLQTQTAGHKSQAMVKTPLFGRFNVSNLLAAAGLCLAAGFDLQTIADGLSALQTVPGRLEKITANDITVLIDYAHTDDALRNVLATLKPLCKGKLRVVFGCGGDRDRTKRPRMAMVAEQLADFIIVTSDNPRTEQPDDIITEIIAGFENPNSPAITIEPDRKKAIRSAVKSAARNDIVLIAGKGHETYQIIGEQRLDFCDKTVAQQCLRERK